MPAVVCRLGAAAAAAAAAVVKAAAAKQHCLLKHGCLSCCVKSWVTACQCAHPRYSMLMQVRGCSGWSGARGGPRVWGRGWMGFFVVGGASRIHPLPHRRTPFPAMPCTHAHNNRIRPLSRRQLPPRLPSRPLPWAGLLQVQLQAHARVPQGRPRQPLPGGRLHGPRGGQPALGERVDGATGGCLSIWRWGMGMWGERGRGMRGV